MFFKKLALNFSDGEAIEVEFDRDNCTVTVYSLDDDRKRLRFRLSPQAMSVLYNLLSNGVSIEIEKGRPHMR